jgi:CRP-like cAMP-binding protein
MKEYSISSDQLALFDRKGKLISAPSTWRYQPPLARTNDVQTSKDAAAKCVEFKGRHEQRILDCLRANGPMIAAEIARATGLDYHAVQRRMAGLRESGLIERTGVVIHGQHQLRAVR